MGELAALGNRTFARVRDFEVDGGLSRHRVPRFSWGTTPLALELLAVHLQASLPELDDLAAPHDSGSICARRSVVSRTLPASTASRRLISVRNDIREAGIRRGGRRQHVEGRYAAGPSAERDHA